MANIIINNNTYQNIDYVNFKKEDGTIATFIDVAKTKHLAPSASFVSAVLGTTGIVANVGLATVKKLPSPTAKLNSIEQGE